MFGVNAKENANNFQHFQSIGGLQGGQRDWSEVEYQEVAHSQSLRKSMHALFFMLDQVDKSSIKLKKKN